MHYLLVLYVNIIVLFIVLLQGGQIISYFVHPVDFLLNTPSSIFTHKYGMSCASEMSSLLHITPKLLALSDFN